MDETEKARVLAHVMHRRRIECLVYGTSPRLPPLPPTPWCHELRRFLARKVLGC